MLWQILSNILFASRCIYFLDLIRWVSFSDGSYGKDSVLHHVVFGTLLVQRYHCFFVLMHGVLDLCPRPFILIWDQHSVPGSVVFSMYLRVILIPTPVLITTRKESGISSCVCVCVSPHLQEFSITPAGYPTIQPNSDTIYPEIASDPRG